MKKIITMIVLSVGICNSAFATTKNETKQFNEAKITEIVQETKQISESMEANTPYGLTKTTKDYYLLNTPFGDYKVERKDGGVVLFGVWVKLENAKNGIYTINSSMGKFEVDTKKCVVIKK